MNRTARIYLLAIDANERRILLELPDSTLDAVEKVKKFFGKESRVITTSTKRASSGNGQKELF